MISEVLDDLFKTVGELDLDPTSYGVYDDEDMIVFALRYLMANIDHAFEPLEDDDGPESDSDSQ